MVAVGAGRRCDRPFSMRGELAPNSQSGHPDIFKSYSFLSLYGESDITIKDILFFEHEKFGKLPYSLGLDGRVLSSFYFKGDIKIPSTWEGKIDAKSEYIILSGF